METYAGPVSEMARKRVVRRAVVGATVGSLVEWYDVAVYAYLAAIMGAVFFPSESSTVQLLSSFAAFAVAFLIRPVGGAFFGSLADRIGRKRTLAYIIGLVTLATALIGVLPGYAQIGVFAPVLLVVLRLVQGFSAGGELTSAAVFVAETSAKKDRGLNVSLVQMGGIMGFLLGSLVVLVLNISLPVDKVEAWGWRIPFLLAGPLGLIGLWIRSRLEESPEFVELKTANEVSRTPLRDAVKNNPTAIFIAIAFSLFHNACLYVIVSYLPNHISQELGFTTTLASLSSVANMVVMCLLIPVFGRLSDKIGRRPVLMTSCVLMLVLGYPLFYAMSVGNALIVVMIHVVFGAVLALFLGATLTALTEFFRPEERSSGLAVGYNVSVSLFGGTAPFFMVLMINGFGDLAAPGWYLVGAALISGIAVWRVRETAPIKQKTTLVGQLEL